MVISLDTGHEYSINPSCPTFTILREVCFSSWVWSLTGHVPRREFIFNLIMQSFNYTIIYEYGRDVRRTEKSSFMDDALNLLSKCTTARAQLYILSHYCDKESEKSTKGGKICGGPWLSPGWFALLLGAWGSENAAVVGTYGTWHRRLLTSWQPSTAIAQGPWKRNYP